MIGGLAAGVFINVLIVVGDVVLRGYGSGRCVHFSMMEDSFDVSKYSDAWLAKLVSSGSARISSVI